MDPECVVEAGQTWANEKKLLQVEANGTPTTFTVAEFNLGNLRISSATMMDKNKLCNHLRGNNYQISMKKMGLI